jgi:hypothetical protein
MTCNNLATYLSSPHTASYVVNYIICVSRARTGLWGVWADNCPDLPGKSIVEPQKLIAHAFGAHAAGEGGSAPVAGQGHEEGIVAVSRWLPFASGNEPGEQCRALTYMHIIHIFSHG